MKLKNLKFISILLLCLCYIFTTNVYAASVTLSGSASGDHNAKITISINGDFTGRVNLSVSNGTLSTNKVWVENNSQSVTVTLGASGTTVVTATPAEGTTDIGGNKITVPSSSKSITIKQPTPPPSSSNTTPPSSGTTNNKPATNTTTNKPNANTTTNKNNASTTTTKSSNANLKNMILSVEGLTPAFSKNITSYSLNVGENVDTIKVNASVEHSRATYSVLGNTGLKDGENVVKVKVTAEDGTVKTYTINVLKSDDPVKLDATLESLIIEDVDLGQAFDPNVTEYNVGDIKVKSNKLNIYAYTNSENAKVEILGNENLGIGQGQVIIRVTSENGKVTKDYVVSFNKLYSEGTNRLVSVYDENSNAVKDEKSSLWDNIKTFYNNTLKENMTVIVLYIFLWIEFIQIVYLYEKLKKYEDLDKITVGKRIKTEKVKKEKVEKTRRVKENPIFPDEEDKK